MRLPPPVALALITLTAAPGASRLRAQVGSATVSATAQVQPFGSINGVDPLRFGVVFPGVPKTVPPTDAMAGEFNGMSFANARINLTFTLPATLRNGPRNLAIGNWAAIYNTVGTPAGGTAFTPSAAPTTVRLGPDGRGWIFIGARVNPTAVQASGVYTGVIRMTATFIGF